MTSSGHTPMPAEVRSRVATRIAGQRWRLAGWLAAMPACVLVAAAWHALTGPGVVFLVGAFLVGFIGPIACLLAAGDAWSRARKLRRDLERGEIEVLEGPIMVVMGYDAALERLHARGELGSDPTASHRAVLLAASGFLHAFDAVVREDFLVPDVLEVAPARPSPIEPLAVGERTIALTAQERAELAARSTQLWKTPAALIGPIAYAALGLTMWRASGTEWLERYGLQLAIWGALGTLSILGLVRRYRTGALVAEDGERGEAHEVIERGDDGALHRVVLLPRSGLIWSVDGVPGAWRSKKL